MPNFFIVRHEVDRQTGKPVNVVFDFTDSFVALHRLSIKPATALLDMTNALSLSYVPLAQDCGFDKGTVQNAIADISQQTGTMLARGMTLELSFSFGVVQANHLKFVFLPPPASAEAGDDADFSGMSTRRSSVGGQTRRSAHAGLPTVRAASEQRQRSLSRPSTSQSIASGRDSHRSHRSHSQQQRADSATLGRSYDEALLSSLRDLRFDKLQTGTKQSDK